MEKYIAREAEEYAGGDVGIEEERGALDEIMLKDVLRWLSSDRALLRKMYLLIRSQI